MLDFFSTATAGPLAAFLASATWALGVVAYSNLSERYPPYVVNVTRILVALPVFVLILFALEGAVATWQSLGAIEGSRYAWLLLAVLSSYAFGDTLFFECARRLGGTSALAISSIYPLWAALSGWLLKGEAFRLQQGFGVTLVVGGTVLVILSTAAKRSISGRDVKLSGRAKLLGVLFGVATSIAWATNSYAINRGGENLPTLLVNAIRLSMGLFLAPLIGMARSGISSFRFIQWKDLKPFWFFITAECFFGPLLYMYGLTRSPLAVGAVLSSLAPVMTVPAAIALRTESFSMAKLGGVLLVVSGICLLLLS